MALIDNQFASCSDDKVIKVWDMTEFNDTAIKILQGHSDSIHALLYMRERNLLLSGGFYGTLHIWSIKTYQSISIIDITLIIVIFSLKNI